MKSFGFIPPKKDQPRIPISSLSKEKIRKLTNLRVIQKTLVYVIGLAPNIASENKIKSLDFFGQYGKIEKIVINTNNVYNGSKGGPSYSGYITYSNPRESAIAILSVDSFMYNERLIRASFGTSKFCQFFLNGQKCTNKDCLYLHELRSDLEAYTKEDMQNNKIIFQE
jgi:CCR4-NOT transcription complex subunit 4